jgi:hypothetical protein
MKALLTFFLLVLGAFASLRADAPPAPEPPVGIIIQKALAGYEASATWFVSIQWIDKDSGFVVDKSGNKVTFLNDAIGRVFYFDQSYYEEVDHNQYWIDWRIVMRDREVLLAPIELNTLEAADSGRLVSEEATLQDAIDRYPVGAPLVQPLIDAIKDQVTKLGSGLVLQNGKWIAEKDAQVASDSVPVVGDAETLITFTTRSGKRFENARVTLSDTGLSVLMPDGGASVSFDEVPANISMFPKPVQDGITDWRNKNASGLLAPAPGSGTAATPAGPATTLTTAENTAADWWVWIVATCQATYQYTAHEVTAYFASTSKDSTLNSSVAPAPTSSQH